MNKVMKDTNIKKRYSIWFKNQIKNETKFRVSLIYTRDFFQFTLFFLWSHCISFLKILIVALKYLFPILSSSKTE